MERICRSAVSGRDGGGRHFFEQKIFEEVIITFTYFSNLAPRDSIFNRESPWDAWSRRCTSMCLKPATRVSKVAFLTSTGRMRLVACRFCAQLKVPRGVNGV